MCVLGGVVLRIAWCITGSGHLLEETVKAFERAENVSVFLSRAGEEVLRVYGLNEDVEAIGKRVCRESRMGSSFPVIGEFMLKQFGLVVVAPATANTVAKIRFGIADSLVSGIVGQALKADAKVAILPTDAQEFTETKLPYNAKKPPANIKTTTVHCRSVDVQNVLELEKNGIIVLRNPGELKKLL